MHENLAADCMKHENLAADCMKHLCIEDTDVAVVLQVGCCQCVTLHASSPTVCTTRNTEVQVVKIIQHRGTATEGQHCKPCHAAQQYGGERQRNKYEMVQMTHHACSVSLNIQV